MSQKHTSVRNYKRKVLTSRQARARSPKSYDFISIKEMEEWQPFCSADIYLKSTYKKKLEAIQELRKALWKYSRFLVYDSCERGGIYEFWANALEYEADSLKQMIKLMKSNRVRKV